jgi:hypothetical protein
VCPANSDKSLQATGRFASPACTLEPSEEWTFHLGRDGDELVENAAAAVDKVRLRLRDAIAASDVDEDEQLNGVLRMLGEEIPEQNQLPLFDKGRTAKHERQAL